MEKANYRTYPYAHYSLGSKPKITNETIDQQISNILNFLNNNPNLSTEQLQFIQSKIKNKIEEKQSKYLVPSSVEPNQKNTTKSVRFEEGTKAGGKRRRKTRKNRRKNRKH
jgi:hypothetical protein